MFDLDFRRMVYLFVLCATLFPNSYYSVNSRHLNFVNDIENFETYPWVIYLYEAFLRELKFMQESLITIKGAMVVAGVERSQVDTHGRMALILYVFPVEHIHAS